MHYGGITFSADDLEQQYERMPAVPVSYYLQRDTNMTLEGVKLLVNACPTTLMQVVDGKKSFTALHALALNKNLSEHLDVLQFLLSNPALLGEIDKHHSIVHVMCSSAGVSLEIVQEVLKIFPDGASFVEDTYGFDENKNYAYGKIGSSHPLHIACRNGK